MCARPGYAPAASRTACVPLVGVMMPCIHLVHRSFHPGRCQSDIGEQRQRVGVGVGGVGGRRGSTRGVTGFSQAYASSDVGMSLLRSRAYISWPYSIHYG